MKKYLIEAVALMAQAQVGADRMSRDLKDRAVEKWQKSKELPRKAKKAMRKDAILDYHIATSTDKFMESFFNID